MRERERERERAVDPSRGDFPKQFATRVVRWRLVGWREHAFSFSQKIGAKKCFSPFLSVSRNVTLQASSALVAFSMVFPPYFPNARGRGEAEREKNTFYAPRTRTTVCQYFFSEKKKIEKVPFTIPNSQPSSSFRL